MLLPPIIFDVQCSYSIKSSIKGNDSATNHISLVFLVKFIKNFMNYFLTKFAPLCISVSKMAINELKVYITTQMPAGAVYKWKKRFFVFF